jgi:hypothetical protein
MIDLPSTARRCAMRLIAIAWNGSIFATTPIRYEAWPGGAT